MSSMDDFTKAVNDATTAMAAKANGKADSAYTADNALKLNGKTADDLVAAVQLKVNTHATDVLNPHKTTAALAGAYDKGEIDTLIGGRVLSGLIPLSYWGVSDGTTDNIPSVSYLASPPRLLLGQVMGLLAGSTASAFSGNVNLTPSAVNYIYFKLTNGLAQYIASTTQLPETNTQMFIGTVTTNATTGVSHTLRAVSRLGQFRVSTTPAGSAIPVSVGFPADPAALAWS